MTLLDSMGAGVCGALAQLAPVFMVLLVAERVVFDIEDDETVEDLIENDDLWLSAGRFVIDLFLAGLCAFLTLSALVGIEQGGYSGTFAESMWILTFALIGIVILRWLFLATPLSLAFTNVARQQARLTLALAAALTRAISVLPRLLQAVLNVVAKILTTILEVAAQFIIGLISLGTAGRTPRTQSNTEWRRRRRPRRRGAIR